MKNNSNFKSFCLNNNKFINLSENELIDKYNKVGTILCDCNHNINCRKCLGDGKCQYCISYKSNNYMNMCSNWKTGYIMNSNINIKNNNKPIKNYKLIDNYENISLVQKMS